MRGQDAASQAALIPSIVCNVISTLAKVLEFKSFYFDLPKAAADLATDEEAALINSRIRCKLRVAALGTFVVIGLTLYSLMKCLMAHVCDLALWNLNGCVDHSQVH